MTRRHDNHLIYNPKAGAKRSKLPFAIRTTIEDIIELLDRYEIPFDITPTQGPGDIKRLAEESAKAGYKTVIVAGGDGTVGEAANGLIGTDTKLGIIPLGTFMNIARMLAIPFDLEKAVMAIKIGRTAKIDVGCVVKESGEHLKEPYYFLESAGVGFDAKLQEYMNRVERGDRSGLWDLLRALTHLHERSRPVSLKTDKETIHTKATLVTIANGPYMGPALKASPAAKLDDHKLTVSFSKSTKRQLFRMAYQAYKIKPPGFSGTKVIKTTTLSVHAPVPLPLHADARLFGSTPASFKVIPKALNVICGYPAPGEEVIRKKSYISP